MVLLLCRMPIESADAQWLVAHLYADAHADAVETALWIEKRINGDLEELELATAHRDAILRV